VGPYVYSEVDSYTNLQYDESTVNATYSQTTEFVADPSGTIDTPIWQLNQGLLRYWTKLNNKPHW